MSDELDNPGPTGWRRVYEGLRNVFMGSPTTPVITVSANNPLTPATTAAVIQVRARVSDPVIKSRQESTATKLQVWDQNLRPLVETKLRSAFHPENYARMFWVMHTSTNVLRRVINDVSVLYENPAKRSLKTPEVELVEEQPTTEEPTTEPPTDPATPAPPPEAPAASEPVQLDTGEPDIDALADVLELTGAKVGAEQSPFDKLMEAYDLDTLLDLVEKLTMICPVVWVRPMVRYSKGPTGDNDPSTGKLTFQLYTPDAADVVEDPENPTEAIAFYYWGVETLPNGADRRVVHFWNRELYLKLDTEWRELDRQPNTLGRLPVTAFRSQLPRRGYYVDGVGEDLYEATIEVCILKTLQNARTKDGAFKQLAIQGDAKDIPSDIVMGGPTPIVLGDENTASVLDFQPNLQAFTQMWEAREISLASTYGISAAEYKQEGVPQSGFAKKLDRDKVLKESRRRRKFFVVAEQDLYENLVATLNVNPLPGVGKLDPKAKLVVDFSEPTFEEDPNTQAQVDALELKFNTTSIIDLLRRSNPDLNDVELVRMAYRNKRINDAFMTTDQLKLADLLATRANVGGSFGSVGQAQPPQPGEDNTGDEQP